MNRGFLVLDQLIQFFANYGYFAVFGVLLLCGFGLPIPEDITLVAGGFISSLSCPVEYNFVKSFELCHQVHYMVIVSMVGVLLGDSIMYFIGRILGPKALNIRFIAKILTPERYEWAQSKFEKYGVFFIFAARFMPGLRAPIFVVAGITQKVSYLKFFLADGFAAIISVPVWIYVGFWGERQLNDMDALDHYVKNGQLGIIAVLGIIIVGIISFWYIKKKIRERNNLPK